MKPLRRRTFWQERRSDNENNTLTIHIERVVKVTPKPTPAKRNSTLEITSPGEDEHGNSIKKRFKLNVDSALVSDVRDAIKAMEIDQSKFGPGEGTVQLRYQGETGAVVMFEVLPYSPGEKMKSRFVICDGKDVRFILVDDLATCFRRLESLSE